MAPRRTLRYGLAAAVVTSGTALAAPLVVTPASGERSTPKETVAAYVAPRPPARASSYSAIRVNGTLIRPDGLVSDPPRIPARAWAIADLDTGRLLGIHRMRTKLPMASTIKLLSSVTAARTVPAYPDHQVTRREAHPWSCSCAGLKVGRTYTREALIAGMLLASGNDAAEATAGSHPLGRRSFIRAMNRIAGNLGATDTQAVNPSGLTAPGGHSSARDLLLFLRAAQLEPVVAPVLGWAKYEFGPRFGAKHTIERRTDYVNTYVDRWPGTQGKSGFTTPAKNTLVVNTPINGHHIGVAILGAPDGTITPSAKKLTVWTARNFSKLRAVGHLPD